MLGTSAKSGVDSTPKEHLHHVLHRVVFVEAGKFDFVDIFGAQLASFVLLPVCWLLLIDIKFDVSNDDSN